ncbi:uncharacterized protein E0L32_000100 [Thyridium curvatum]|uniref:Membrane anchor Opy2 N-terminal domain-containing protein n=1 Tax=Thyridium curvatum TaxID=1093900 RepID=A0A507B9D0_9PEZI|nr:uncharacterized protein E0L32_000100 [Thyridium curvatum]TPX15766.1 hypothetical protein E0L32_000100 [Thyridium curvatum]
MAYAVRDAAVAVDDLLPRQNGCVKCLDATPECPTCPAGQSCQITVPLVCTECPRSYCAVNDPAPTQAPAPSNKPSAGAIAGGVIGGLVVIAAVTYLVWRFCIKAKRQPMEVEQWDEEHDTAAMEAEKSFAARRDQRSSTHTAHSIASTVLTRASNIIQIAYIPGVTNRATPTSPTLLVPPVPPIPIAVSQASSPSATGEEQHFFVPGDLRDSTYSALSGYSDRTSYARTSYAPRSSIASTIYGKNAVIVAPAQTGMRARPAMVSVKSAATTASGGSTPPVPSVDYEKYNKVARPPSPAGSTFSVGSTFLNNASAHTAMTARPQVVRVGSGQVKQIGTVKEAESADEDNSASTSPNNKARASAAVTLIDDSPSPDQGPFSDPPAHKGHKSTGSLSAVIEEATRRASQRNTLGTSSGRERSPFGDEHATNDN